MKTVVKKYGQVFFMGVLIGTLGYLLICRAFLHSVIIGTSMEPLLHDGDQTFGIRCTDGFDRGDVVSFYPTVDSDGYLYVKRIIGLPGETVTVDEGKVYIDGRLLDEPYLDGSWAKHDGPYEFHVPDGHYLLFGDNRNGSYDARMWDDPYVPISQIKARTYVYYRPGAGFHNLYEERED